MLRATATATDGPVPYDIIVLSAEDRHLRRKVLVLQHGEEMFIDLASPVRLSHGDRLVLDDGRHIEVIAADEPLLEASVRDAPALARIAWHLGNRHTRVEFGAGSLTLQPDHVLEEMLVGLGAEVRTIEAPFEPERPLLHGVPHHHAHE